MVSRVHILRRCLRHFHSIFVELRRVVGRESLSMTRCQQSAHAVPGNFDTDADEQERDDPENTMDEGGRNSFRDGRRVGTKHIEHRAQQNDAESEPQKGGNACAQGEILCLGTQREDDGDGAWPDRNGKGEGIKCP